MKEKKLLQAAKLLNTYCNLKCKKCIFVDYRWNSICTLYGKPIDFRFSDMLINKQGGQNEME